MVFIGPLLLFLAGQATQELSIDQFREQYRKESAATQARLTDLHIRETRDLGNGKQAYQDEAFVVGDYVKVINRQNGTFRALLSRDCRMSLMYQDAKQSWRLDEYQVIPNEARYREERRRIVGRLPNAFKLPFQVEWFTPLIDLLDGKVRSAPNGAGGALKVKTKEDEVDSQVRVTAVKILGTGGSVRYRVELEVLVNGEKFSRSYVEVDPSLGWQITRGGDHRLAAPKGNAWTIEYGAPVNGVPIMKKYTYSLVGYDPKTGAEIAEPGSTPTTIIVDLAEPWHEVDAAEFTPEYYHVEPPRSFDPNHPPEMPTWMFWALGGVVGFIALILLLHLATRRATRTSPST